MNSQEQWKKLYRSWHNVEIQDDIVFRSDFYNIRREAALERKLAAAQREIERLQKMLDMANYAVWNDRL